MGLIAKILSMLASPSVPNRSNSPESEIETKMTTGITATMDGRSGQTVQVSDDEVADRVSKYTFVVTTDLPTLKPPDQWYNEEAQQRRYREKSKKLYAWLSPFVPIEIAQLINLTHPQDSNPNASRSIAKKLRASIRERRKAKKPYRELLSSLYGICIAADITSSLEFEGISPRHMASFVDINEIHHIAIDFRTVGYKHIKSLAKTDIKWLIEAFDEPTEHQPIDILCPHIRQNAVARYCWSELRKSNKADKSLGLPQKTMEQWLENLVKQNIRYYKEWQASVATREVNSRKRASILETAWAATRHTFVVADLETTGLNSETDEVLEFAALIVAPDGSIIDEFSTLVRVSRQIPREITILTGITQDAINRNGRPPLEALLAFTAFVGAYPIFFHNAPFDQGFLSKTASRADVKFVNPVHDTLTLARQAWPSLSSHKLANLAKYIGAEMPTHRALDDAKAALAVLLAARQKVFSKS